jgi:hypothetical protein
MYVLGTVISPRSGRPRKQVRLPAGMTDFSPPPKRPDLQRSSSLLPTVQQLMFRWTKSGQDGKPTTHYVKYWRQMCGAIHAVPHAPSRGVVINYAGNALLLRFLGSVCKTAKSVYQLRHVCLSVCPHGTTQLPLDGYS